MDCSKGNAMAGLPDEAMLEILARVPFKSVCRSKCVAKAWRDLIDDPLNRGRLPQTLRGFLSISYSLSDQTCNLEHGFVKYSASSVPLDIDPCPSFPTKLSETEMLNLVDYCNGLFLLERRLKPDLAVVLSYIVCNPATKHWATVPVCLCSPLEAQAESQTYLVFDPAPSGSLHFHLIQIFKPGWDEETPLTFEEIDKLDLSVHTYSSETGVWSHSQTDWDEHGQFEGWRHQGYLRFGRHQRTFVNGILHLIVSGLDRDQIVAIDVQGKTKRIFTTPDPDAAEGSRWYSSPLIGQSQGRMYYIKDFDSRQAQNSELSIWELQDYDTQEWVLKDTVSFSTLFGRMTGRWEFVVIHPDRNVVFFLGPMNRLIAYDMDCKEVSVVFMSSEDLDKIVPYIPYFSESPALTNKNCVCSNHGAASNLVGL